MCGLSNHYIQCGMTRDLIRTDIMFNCMLLIEITEFRPMGLTVFGAHTYQHRNRMRIKFALLLHRL